MCWTWIPGRSSADRIPHTRAADLAWLPDGTRLLLHPLSRARARCPRARSTITGRSASTASAPIPPPTRSIFQPAEKEHWPSVGISPDGRWLVIGVARTFDQTDLYLQDLRAGAPPVRGRQGSARLVRWRGGARPAVPAHQPRRADLPAVRGGPRASRTGRVAGDRAAAARRRAGRRAGHRAIIWRSAISSARRPAWCWPTTTVGGRREVAAARPRQPLRRRRGVGRTRAVLRLLVVHRPARRLPDRPRAPAARRCGARWRRTWIPRRFEVSQVAVRSRDGTEVSMFLVHRAGPRRATGPIRCISPATAASTSA